MAKEMLNGFYLQIKEALDICHKIVFTIGFRLHELSVITYCLATATDTFEMLVQTCILFNL